MDRRKRHVVVIAVAVITATLASFGVFLAIKRIPVREVEVAHSFVVVAARPLATGVRLTAADVRVVPWPTGNMISGSASRVEDVIGRGLLSAALENEPLTDSKLATREAGAGLPPSIPAGMRAMSVKVNDVIGVAGFIDAGTRVDLMVTIRKKDDSITRTVASNVEVLTSGTRYDREQQEQQQPKSKDSKPASVTPVVTLLVTPDDAERITLAQAEGQIMLVLRNPLDTAPTATSGARTAALLGPSPAEPPPPAPKPAVVRKPHPAPAVAEAVAPAPAPRAYTVEAIRAAKRSEEVIH